jgi:fructose-specific phosphotransferase system IIC component
VLLLPSARVITDDPDTEVPDMGCLLAVLAGFFPRFVLIVYWILRPERVDAIFTSFIWPLLGLIFLPFATLMYILLYVPGRGITSWDWLWVFLAALLDIAHWGASARERQAVPR